MKPEDVPDELIDMAYKASRSSEEMDIAGMLVDVLAAVLPEHEKQVRARVATEIRDYAGQRPDDIWQPSLWSGLQAGARIAGDES
jgi:hypothetical protein